MSLSKSNKPLKILQIASGDLWAGAEVQLYNLCIHLEQQKGAKLFVALLNEGELADRLRVAGICVQVFDELRLGFWQVLQELFSYCRRINPDLIHSHRIKENILAGCCSVSCGIPSIRTVHGASEFNLSRFSTKQLVQQSDLFVGRFLQKRIVAVSGDLRVKLLQDYRASHIVVVKNGIDFTNIDQAAEFKLPKNVFNIGIIGRLTAVKRVDLFIDMAAALVKKELSCPLRFHIIGGGPLSVQYESKVVVAGIEDVVSFTGHISSAIPYMKALDLLVMCSDHEGTPMTILESMRCGLPIVAHDVGGLRELLAGGECGHLVSAHTAQGYAAAVESLLIDSGQRELFAKKALERVSDYSAAVMAQEYLDLYQKVINA